MNDPNSNLSSPSHTYSSMSPQLSPASFYTQNLTTTHKQRYSISAPTTSFLNSSSYDPMENLNARSRLCDINNNNSSDQNTSLNICIPQNKSDQIQFISTTLPTNIAHTENLRKPFSRQSRLSKRNLLNNEQNDIDENEEYKNTSDMFSFSSKKNKISPFASSFTEDKKDFLKQNSITEMIDEISQGKIKFSITKFC